MENIELLDQGLSSSNEGLSATDKNYLFTAARWSKFLGIVGFVFTGFIILGGIGMMAMGGFLFSGMGNSGSLFAGMGVLAGVFYLLFAALYFYISLYLYRFGSKMQDGLNSSTPTHVTEAFKNLKGFFQLTGIFTAVIIVFYILFFVMGIGTGLMGSY
jgi:hypothetical protein